MRKIIATIASIALLAGLTACGGSEVSTDQTTKSDSSSKTQLLPKPQPADLTGTWKQTNSNSDDTYMRATVADGAIKVEYIMGDTTALFWAGSYEAPTEAGDWKWDSANDQEQTQNALLASTDDTKTFEYSDSSKELSFPMTMQGVTATIKMQKQ